MANKGFDLNLKRRYDRISKQHTEEVMRDLVGARKITDNEAEDRGDFSQGFWDQAYALPGSSKTILVESEMKNEKWWGPGYGISGPGPFRYETMDIPYRKEKNQASIYMLFSTDIQYGFVVTRKAMDESVANGVKRKKTIYEENGGDYFSIPVEKGFFVERDGNGRWHRWKKIDAF